MNAQSGVQTPAGGIITGLSVVIATQFLTPAFKYIPTAALAAVIMLAAISMFDTDGVKHAWRVNKMDLFPLVVAFGICFYEIAVSTVVVQRLTLRLPDFLKIRKCSAANDL